MKNDIHSFMLLCGDPPQSLSLWKGIWGVKTPWRVSFFVWMATWGKILTCNNLRRRWYTIVDWCCMYWCSGEGVDHLLIYRTEAYQLWSFVFRSFGISWVLLERVVDRLFGWWNWMDKYSSRLRNLVSSCLMWIILLERNRRTIEDLEKTRSIS